ncbi:purine nucleoside phosphorylase [Methylobacterium sp. Leaf104]|uniref:purine-nucleoside phosphorylase n=1 Tax=Methylobacterium TaxID=407 RepID=UPI0006FF4989|nr:MULTISPECIES: purine-nucleoside phosphorylase [Methylobacterium]KQP33765.1 purine nucleoside phosphorylase [Methylobacterium sp. Leaf104]MCI9879672.1 purine-nucleoside phosphorylase [Methylobacterium goesingense]
MREPEPGVQAAAGLLRARGFGGPFACAIVTGTGLGGFVRDLDATLSVSYAQIPGFPAPRVSGHGGRLHAGRLAGRRVLVLEGRAHAYETGDAAVMRVPLGVAQVLGAEALLLTNASGSLRPAVGPGSLVALTDHINLSGLNPLIGEAGDARFVPMVGAYDAGLRAHLLEAARESGIALHQGVYAWFSGPSFETPAEVRMVGHLGADLVGMSTVPEVILARFYGLPVAALSVVTNLGAGIGDGDPHHEETKAAAARAGDDLARLVAAFVARLSTSAPR